MARDPEVRELTASAVHPNAGGRGARQSASPTLLGHKGAVNSVAFSPDGRTLASGSDDETIKLWEVATGREARTLVVGQYNSVRSVAFSPDGRTLASEGVDDTIKLYEVGTGRELRTLACYAGFVGPVAFSPDGQYLASGGLGYTICLWRWQE